MENFGCFAFNRRYAVAGVVNSLPVKDGDIIISDYYAPYSDLFLDFNNIAIEAKCRTPEKVFFAYSGHPTPDGYELIAQHLLGTLEQHNFFENTPSRDVEKIPPLINPHILRHNLYGNRDDLALLYGKEFREYRDFLIKSRGTQIGAIVMNCNPFTLGHRHLIKYAAQQVLHLYIFVVEEDRSIFPFEDRIDLVNQGVADLSNVTVLPSGQFIISQLTFSGYFNKSNLQDQIVDSSQDVELFARKIAPLLGITIRFVGEEPFDWVTKQYNENMRHILPRYGIDFAEIPRKEVGSEPISASRVRGLLKENRFEDISQLVPKTTLEYLKENWSKKGIVKNEKGA